MLKFSRGSLLHFLSEYTHISFIPQTSLRSNRLFLFPIFCLFSTGMSMSTLEYQSLSSAVGLCLSVSCRCVCHVFCYRDGQRWIALFLSPALLCPFEEGIWFFFITSLLIFFIRLAFFFRINWICILLLTSAFLRFMSA